MFHYVRLIQMNTPMTLQETVSENAQLDRMPIHIQVSESVLPHVHLMGFLLTTPQIDVSATALLTHLCMRIRIHTSVFINVQITTGSPTTKLKHASHNVQQLGSFGDNVFTILACSFARMDTLPTYFGTENVT